MRTVRKDILVAVLVLTIIAAVSGILLGIVYPLTRLTESELAQRAQKELPTVYPAAGYETVDFESKDEKLNSYVPFIFSVKDEPNTFILQTAGGGGYKGRIEMYVVVKEGKIIKISKGKNNETPGISDKAFEEGFLSQFKGIDLKNVEKFELAKGDKPTEVDGVAGATKTSTGVTNAINNAVAFYKEFSDINIIVPLGENHYQCFVRSDGEYTTSDGAVHKKYVKLIVEIKDGKIFSVNDNGSTFSPPMYSEGLKQENLDRFVGKDAKGEKFEIGENIDNVATATGTTKSVVDAINMALELYQREVAKNG